MNRECRTSFIYNEDTKEKYNMDLKVVLDGCIDGGPFKWNTGQRT